jgi:replicative DNA helicase
MFPRGYGVEDLTEEMRVPFSAEAEASVIGSILIDSEVLKEIDLAPEDFFTQCRTIYEVMVSLNGQVDQITVAHELQRTGKLQEIGGASYLSQIISEVPTSMNAEYYAKIVKECAINRRIMSAAHKIIAKATENGNPAETLAEAQSLISTIELPQSEIFSANELALKASDHYGSLRTRTPGILTGIKAIDDKLGGLLPGESVCLAANTSVGKTTLALQVARNISKTKKVLIDSEEMTAQSVTDKMVASISGVSTKLINLGNYTDERLGKLLDALDEVHELNLHVTRCGTTSKLRNQIEKYKPELVIVDYLQKLRDNYGTSDYQRVGFISNELTSMAKEYNIPLIALSQLHRTTGDQKKQRPMLSHLRDSGKLEEDFDMVWALYRESYFDFLEGVQASSLTTELIVLKNRLRGNTGPCYLIWSKENEQYV